VRSLAELPDEATVAAIVAAVDATWPRPADPVAPDPVDASRWRFSARWWAQTTPSRPARPW